MPIDQSDAAYVYALKANEKEARNAQRRAERNKKKKDPHPAWLCVSGVCLLGAAVINYEDALTFSALALGLAGGMHLVLAYQNWRRRSKI